MELKRCGVCVMDGTAKELVLTENGCNFCERAKQALKEIEYEKIYFVERVFKIMDDGKDKPYDCLIGLSGGVDSSTLLVKAIELGLRPLCYTIDNGYNDPKADENILKLVEQLKVPFFRYTIDEPKFKSLQGAFMQAGLINLKFRQTTS